LKKCKLGKVSKGKGALSLDRARGKGKTTKKQRRGKEMQRSGRGTFSKTQVPVSQRTGGPSGKKKANAGKGLLHGTSPAKILAVHVKKLGGGKTTIPKARLQ